MLIFPAPASGRQTKALLLREHMLGQVFPVLCFSFPFSKVRGSDHARSGVPSISDVL